MKHLLVLCCIVQLAFGQTAFKPSNILNFPSVAAGMSSGDIDGDGDADLLLSNTSTGVSWYENNGDGTFGKWHFISSQYGDYEVELEDMDNDGDLDAIVLDYFEDRLLFFSNMGDGTFAPLLSNNLVSSSLDLPKNLRVKDLNNDGFQDLLVVNNAIISARISLWYSNNGNFGPMIQFPAVSFGSGYSAIRSADAGDIDGDGDIDLVVGSENPAGGLIYYYEDTSGTQDYTDAALIQDELPARLDELRLGDYDNDGDLDIFYMSIQYASGSIVTQEVEYIENFGDGEFGSPQSIASGVNNQGMIALEDLDYDGDIDVLITSNNTSVIYWYENTECGVFIERNIQTGQSISYNDIEYTDIDNDGYKDIVINSQPARLSWYKNDGQGNFSENILTEQGSVLSPLTVLVEDLDQDGDLDIVVASSQNNTVSWFPNENNIGFLPRKIIGEDLDYPSNLSVADMDNDGDLDLVVGAEEIHSLYWIENLGNSASWTSNLISSSAMEISGHTTSDLDGDGDLDIVAALYETDRISLYENLGNGNFSNPTTLVSNAIGANNVLADDMDGDGDPDIVYSAQGLNAIAWLRNTGNLSFATGEIISSSVNNVSSIATIDLDFDGNIDVLSASFFDSKIAWHSNQGNGIFAENILSTTISGASKVRAIDCDNDGDIDVVSSSQLGESIFLHERISDTAFLNPQTLDEDYEILSDFSTGDIDADGDQDIVALSIGDHNIRLLDNLLHWDTMISVFTCDSFQIDSGNFASQSGVYSTSFINQYGGDSSIAYTLTLGSEDSTLLSATICLGDTFSIGETNFSSSGSYTLALSNSCGLDSTVVLDLHVRDTLSYALTYDTICSDLACYKVGNSYYNATGIFIDTLRNFCGGDSILETHLVVYSADTTELSEVICFGDTVELGEQLYASSGEYTAVFINTLGCDSTVLLELEVRSIDLAIIQDGAELSATSSSSNTTYQWVTCPSGEGIPNANSASYRATENGSYAVVAFLEGCTDTSQCVEVNNVTLNETEKVVFSVFPNPTSGFVNLEFQEQVRSGNVKVRNLFGNVVFDQEIEDTKFTVLSLKSLPAGTYLIEYSEPGYLHTYKVLKQ